MIISKACFKCRIKKPLSEFYAHKQMGDGHLGKCKSCTKKDVQDRYNDPVKIKEIHAYEKKRSSYPHRIEYRKKYIESIKKNHKGKYRAWKKLKSGIARGRIKNEPCAECGSTKVDAHHPDYRKPLFIIWLCRSHHKRWHRDHKKKILK